MQLSERERRIDKALDELVPLLDTEGALHYALQELCDNVYYATDLSAPSIHTTVALVKQGILNKLEFKPVVPEPNDYELFVGRLGVSQSPN